MRKPILLGPLPPPYGGVATFVRALVDASRDSDISVWAYGKGNYRGPSITQFHPRKFGIARLILTKGRGARITDTSHFHLEYPNPALLPIWLAAKTLVDFEWVKVVLDGSLPSRYPSFSPIQRRLFHQAIKSITQFVTVSEEIRTWLKDEINASQRIDVIPCLLPGPEDVDMPEDLQHRLADYGNRAVRVVSSGTFISTYGFDQIAEAIGRIRNECDLDIGLLFIDGNFARDEVYRKKIMAEHDWITAVEGVDNRFVPAILKASNLFVRGVEFEGFGISRIEALWAGVPVVATAVGETRGMTTYRFGDVDELTKRIKEALAGTVAVDAAQRAEQFRGEARANLQAYLKVMRGIS